MSILKILIFFHIYIILIYPQTDEFIFEDLTIENGLSSNRVTSILQDSRGFIWIGTEDGLNRFDGYTFKKYLNIRGDNNSISNNYIWSLSEDKNGNIWVATNGGGLNKFDPVYEKFYHYRYEKEDTTSLSLDIVKYVYTDKKGDLWAGTWGGGLNLYDPLSDSFIRFKNNPDNTSSLGSNKIWCIYEDSKNNFWIGTSEGGLNLFDRRNSKVKRYLPDAASQNSFSGTSAVTICEDSRGNLWIGTHGNGINRYDYNSGIFTNFSADGLEGSISGNIIWKILEDNQGLLWIATQGNGFNIFDFNSNKFKKIVLDSSNPQDPTSNNVKDIFEDRSSVLWIGMFTSGIKKINRKPFQFSSLKKNPGNPNSLPENFVYTMCEDAYGDIWIGTYSSLIRYRPLKGSFISYPVNQSGKNAVSGQRVRYIYRDSHNDIWIGTYFGKLNKYDRSTDSFKKYSLAFKYNAAENSNVRVIYEDSKGYLWIGTNGTGLIKYDRLNNKHKIFDTKSSEISGDIVLSIIEDKKGNLWIGTFGRGLNKYNIESGFIHFNSDPNDKFSLSDNSITELYIDSNDNLWIGTFSGGLCRYDYNENNFRNYKEIDGLAGNYVSGILEDDHYNLWISTSKGISRFSPVDSVLNKFKNYNFTQGLQKGEFIPGARLKTKNNIMYFGGVNGINYFHPDSLVNASNISPVVITSFKIQNSEADLVKNIVFTDTILLNHDQNYFSFEFACLDYTYSGKNMYSYILKGVDKDWNYSGSRRFASYTHLDPGEYEFKVKGANSEGIWNEAGASIILIISPPFWGTWWFRALMILIFLSFGPVIYFRRVSTLKKEKTATEEFSRRLIQSQENERKRIASELHDSLGQNLLILKNLAALGIKSKEEIFKEKKLEEISDNASSAIDEVRRISYNLHPYHLERLGLTKAILSIINNIDTSSNIKFVIKCDNIDNLLDKEGEINLFRIVQEGVNNIIRHSSADKAEIKINNLPGSITLDIKDNGKGFKKEDYINSTDPAKGFGIKNLQKRVNILNGIFTLNSSEKKGTHLNIIIPLKND